MASPFKIPKKKQPAGADSAPLYTSPLSCLQSSAPDPKQGYQDQSSSGRADRVHAGNTQSASCEPVFRDVVKTLLGLNCPTRGASAANHKGASAANHRGVSAANRRAGWSGQSEPGQRAGSSAACFSNGWRPKRASDRLLQPAVTSEPPSPPQKKKSDLSGRLSWHSRSPYKSTESSVIDLEPSGWQNKSISVKSLDSLAELRGEEHAGSLSSSKLGEQRTWRRVESDRRVAAERKSDTRRSPESLKQQRKISPVSGSDRTSEDDFLSPSRTTNKPSVTSLRMSTDRRRSLDRKACLATRSSLTDDLREKGRERWREFREKKKTYRSAVPHLRLKKPKQTPTEPIVLSSEEEEGDDEGDGGKRMPQSLMKESGPGSSEQKQAQQACSSKAEINGQNLPPPLPSFLQLDFTSLHAGLTHSDANGKLMISESGVTIPLKGAEEGEVTVVASQVRGYGVWDGGVARGGTLLAGWKGPAPSLLFLWVTDAQANLLQRELSAIQTSTAAASGSACSVLLLVLKEQLQELQAALLASILDMEEYRKGFSSSAGGPTSPLEWTDGLLLLHSCPPPLDQHLLRLLGHSAVRSSPRKKNSSGQPQLLPTRLIQYPPPPSKGRITVTKEDLACLNGGEFLNDVIIDFYLKYLLLEGVGGSVADRSHVFSSFFYKQLSRRRAAGEDDAPSVPDRHMRHQRVKTWTRQVDIFTKDFLFVPVNQEAHWFLVVVCFPGLEEVQYEEFQRPTGASERAAGKPSSFSLRSQQPPECTQQSWQRDTVLKRPCILVMDSLKLSYHENVCRLLRDYLQVEWEVRRGTPRVFGSDNMRSSNCRVPQQDNSSDCGLYLLQYAESFLQNPVVHFDLPLRLENWFPRQRVRQKREEIRALIMRMHQSQNGEH
ncbi:sentrin-specific protease 7b isoform X3 [Epinephelus moara]|uniref:sentrin-specific protease 7b isoform X3 n=1 Tax=Epinephelus moara TaxID=300413 RepID=UPI00214E33F5|nr:sentrin-specific protease 7b isoform X3 [Epinephelus moara]